MIQAVDHVRTMAPYALANLGGATVTSLAQNESAFAPSPTALAAGEAALRDAPLYPDPDWGDLCAAIAEAHELPTGDILCGAGSMELIGCLIRAFVAPGDEVLGTAHGYLFARTAAQQAGACFVSVPEPDYTVSVRLLLEAVTTATKIVFVCNPGNPTGTRLPGAELIRLRKNLRSDILLVVDQAYAEFDPQDPASVFDLVGNGDTAVLRTFSKAYGLAGCRVGWGLFPPGVALEMRKLMNPNNISGVAQAMATAAVRDQAHMLDVVARTAALRERAAGRLRAIGLDVPQSHTNFILIPFENDATAAQADQALRSAGLLLRGMAGYGLPQCLRATVGRADAMERMCDVLERFMEGVG
ncbi:aminotransferase class I/II-fold pyridoxal phosphate-dependent enzyme [Pseudohalocynthiibacter aestuariivivens]|nr:histidinol-phosphate transaminase [Pseudohalocynthiibacter aestuariivivens]QIE46775.1 aminotransferase class I/II-fold pyridoxal phosphate-dependent enzyme [Pseudohalocynthiibacter aestuariivivens]